MRLPSMSIAHGGKETVNQLGGEIFFAAGVVTDEKGQFFFGDRRQMLFLRGRGGTKELRELPIFALLIGNYDVRESTSRLRPCQQ